MEPNTLAERISDCIEKWDIVGLNSEIQKSENKEWIQNNAWDLIPILVEPANETNLQKCPQVVHSCSQILADYVARWGNPKEIIISLLEQCEHSGSSIKFRHCLPALEIALVKLELRPASLTWDWALRSVVDHVTAQELPNLVELEGEERLVFEHDHEYSDRLRSCEEVTNLLKCLQLRLNVYEEDMNGTKRKLKGYILWSCIQILGSPLSCMNICTTAKGISTTAKVVSDELLSLISNLLQDPVQLMILEDFCQDYGCSKMTESDRQVWSFGIGNLFFCAFVMKDDPGIPLCYSPFHLFSLLAKPMISMLAFNVGESSHYLRQEKSLLLCKSLLNRLHVSGLPLDALEMEDHSNLWTILYQVIIYHGLESIRKLAFEVYNLYFTIFAPKGRPLTTMVQHALEKANHSGLIGHAIGKLKNGLMSGPDNYISVPILQGLVRKFCVLKNGAETDLLEVSDEIMSTLNFLVCLLLRDKSNALGLWDIVPQLKADYLEPLATGLSMSRAHYKLKLEENADPNSATVSLMVGGQTLPEMSKEQMKEVVQSALNTFDMIDCVLCQLNDVVNKRIS